MPTPEKWPRANEEQNENGWNYRPAFCAEIREQIVAAGKDDLSEADIDYVLDALAHLGYAP